MRRSTRRESNNKAVTSIEKAKHFCVLGQDQDGLEARYINDYIGKLNFCYQHIEGTSVLRLY